MRYTAGRHVPQAHAPGHRDACAGAAVLRRPRRGGRPFRADGDSALPPLARSRRHRRGRAAPRRGDRPPRALAAARPPRGRLALHPSSRGGSPTPRSLLAGLAARHDGGGNPSPIRVWSEPPGGAGREEASVDDQNCRSGSPRGRWGAGARVARSMAAAMTLGAVALTAATLGGGGLRVHAAEIIVNDVWVDNVAGHAGPFHDDDRQLDCAPITVTAPRTGADVPWEGALELLLAGVGCLGVARRLRRSRRALSRG